MSNIRLQGNPSGTGTLTIASPNTNSDFTFNLPASNGTIPVLASVTNNGVVFVNGSGQTTSGSALTFDGTVLTNTRNTTDGSAAALTLNNSGATASYATLSLNAGTVAYQQFSDAAGNAIGTAGVMCRTTSNHPLLWGTNNTERMRLDSSGNLGLGVTPSAWGSGYKGFEVGRVGSGLWQTSNSFGITSNAYNASGWKYAVSGLGSVLYEAVGNTHAWYNAPSGTAGNAISFTQAMTLDPNGRLGIGTTSPGARLTVFGGWQQISNGSSSLYMGDGVNLVVSSPASASAIRFDGDALLFSYSSTERARIDSSGNLLVGTTSPYLNRTTSNGGYSSTNSQQFNITSTSSSDGFEWVLRTGTEMRFYVSNATVMARLTASGVWTDASDARYKENIRPVSYGLAEVMQLQPRAYNVIGSERQEIGFVAQEVEPLIPELVESTRNSVTEEDRLTLSYGQLSAVIVKAIQELNAKLEAQAAEIAALKGTA